MEKIKLTIDSQRIEARSGATVLEAAQSAGIYIPSLCYYPGLRPLAEVVPDMACQLCLAEVDGKVVLSCTTKVSEGMVVSAETPRVKELRQRHLLAILRRHPPENITGELKKAADYIGIKELDIYIPKKLPIQEDSPFFLRDNNLCILCERCVRVCDDVRWAGVIEFAFPCYRACPAGIDIPRYIRLIARGRPGAALAVIREKVPFPGVLGRVCIHPCEVDCQRGLEVDDPLQIRMLKRFATDNGDDSWKKLSKRLPPSGKSVAVIGSGPAGLTVAYYLTKLGHKITVFEALPKAGGMMLVGIPEYRLPREVLNSEIEEIKSTGVEIKLNTRVESLDSLFGQGYNAVFLGIGAHQGVRLGVEGEDLPGVIEAAEFLRWGNLGERIEVGERVGIVGGGNVAIDAARMSLRFGANKVNIFYRRTRTEMPASSEEINDAMEEGVEFVYLVSPTKVTCDNGNLKLECIRMKLGEPDASGRARPIPIEGSEFTTELDTLVAAIGQRPEVSAGLRVEVGRGNVIRVDANMRTSREGVFSGGDCVSGPASVIEAIAAGRKAAEVIDCYLGGRGDISELLVPAEEATTWFEGDFLEEKLAPISHLPRKISIRSFDEVEQAWDWDTAMAEARRCLQCNVITPLDGKVLQDAGCQFCGACVDSCPTGALVEKSVYQAGPPDRVITTICPYCGVGCQLKLEIEDEQIIRVVPDTKDSTNRGQACVKGKFGLDFVHDPNRLTSPLIKRDGEYVETTWDEALELVASKLASYGKDEVAVISSAKCTNEENYVAQKFARAVLDTNNIDHCARLCHAPTVAGLVQCFGSGAMTNSIDEIGSAACILAIGTNTTEAHPVIGLEVKRAVRNGAKLIVANPREIELVRFADLWLQHKPGTDVALLMGMMRVIVDEGLADSSFIEERCENFDDFRESLKNFDLDSVERITGVPKNKIAEAARIYATNKPSSLLYAMGITQHSHGTDNVIATANLAMLTGNIGKPSTGVNPLRGQNNVQGACDLGALPNVYTGYQAVADQAIREKFEAAWDCSLPSAPGLTITEAIPAAYDGKIKAFYLIGENPVLSEPDAGHAREALEKLDFFVVQDIFLTETAQLADVVLPGVTFAEKDGTFTNTERRVQRVRKAIEPIGNSRPDWLITCQIARKMGSKGFNFAHPSQIMEEIASLTPSYGGISYSRLDNGGLQWPCPTQDHPGTPILHATVFTRGKGRFIPLEYKPPMELPDDEYPLILTTERSLFHFHTGTMTRKVGGLNILLGEGMVEINPEDASALGITDGEMVKVISRRGEVVAEARVTEVSPIGVVSMNFHFAESPTNVLTSPALDPVSKIPEYKVCAVRIERNGNSS
ncbi:formate dehydrogenase subunit alpha [Chloroflexota bacterium]